MIFQYLVYKKKINAGLERTFKECEACIGAILFWLAEDRPTMDLVNVAISEYHRYQRDSKYGIEMTRFRREEVSRMSSGGCKHSS